PGDLCPTIDGNLRTGNAPETDAYVRPDEPAAEQVPQRARAFEAGVRAHDHVRAGTTLEQAERPSGMRREHVAESRRPDGDARVGMTRELREHAGAFLRREARPLGVDEHAVLGTEVVRQILHRGDLPRGLAGAARDEDVPQTVSDDVETR